jgi:hypothetical protein
MQSTKVANGAAPVMAAKSIHYFFKGFWQHLLLVIFLTVVAAEFAAPSLGDDQFLGLLDTHWFWWGLGLSVLHQVLVWMVFRGQLGWGVLTRWFGEHDLTVWGAVFLPLMASRPLMLLGLAIADRGSMASPRILQLVLGIGLLLPSLYAMYSVMRYFGVPRALGGDHFRLQYRQMPLVTEGAYRWTPHAMYMLVFLAMWAIAFLAGSMAALSLAAFEHAYVWVHYFCTEKPDMELMYGDSP